MKKDIKRIAWQIVGTILLIIGIAGLFLPILQGLILVLVGLFILSLVSESFKAKWHHFRKRFPSLHQRISTLEGKIEKRIGHWFHD